MDSLESVAVREREGVKNDEASKPQASQTA